MTLVLQKTQTTNMQKNTKNKEENEGSVDLFLTNINLNSNPPLNVSPIKRHIEKSIRAKKPGLAHGGIIKEIKGDTFRIEIPFDNTEHTEDGRKINIFIPKDGLPIYLGQDAIEKMMAMAKKKQTTDKKRLMRLKKFNCK